MLTKLRDALSSWIGLTILVLVLFAFSFFGIESYFSASSDTYVAKVGNVEISQQTYQNTLNNTRRNLLQSKQKPDPSYLDSTAFKQGVLHKMVNQQILLEVSNKLGVVVADASLRRQIASTPQFQVDGKFNSRLYQAALAQSGYTPEQYQQGIAQEMLGNYLPQAIADTAIVTPKRLDRLLQLQGQTRDFRFISLPVPTPTNAQVTQTEITTYYQQHHQEFMTPAMVSVQYVELTAATMQPAVPDAAALQALYKKEKSRFTQAPEYQVAHILIALPSKATAKQQQEALSRAEKIEAQLKAKGANFAALAKKYSADLGSKNQGGLLGWLGKGDTGPTFQKAMLALQPGQISAPVLSKDGYHIIKLLALRPGKVQPFAEVRAQLLTQAKKTARDREYSSIAGKLTDKTYANPASLTAAASSLKLLLKVSAMFSRKGGQGIFANPKVVKVAFSDQILKLNSTSDPISLGPQHIVILHLAKYAPTRPIPVAEASHSIRGLILAERIHAAAKQRAEKWMAGLHKATTNLDKLAKQLKLTVQDVKAAHRAQPGQAPALNKAVFTTALPSKGKPVPGIVDLGQGHFSLFELQAVHAGDLSKLPVFQREYFLGQIGKMQGYADVENFVQALRRVTKVKLQPKNL